MSDVEEVAKIIFEDKVSSVIAREGISVTAAKKDLSRNANDSEILGEILNQLKILNLYMAEGFNFTFTEEDIEDNHDY